MSKSVKYEIGIVNISGFTRSSPNVVVNDSIRGSLIPLGSIFYKLIPFKIVIRKEIEEKNK